MTIIALAGRRIDAPDATVARFPLAAITDVRKLLRDLFTRHHATWLVASGACGADLLALDVAGSLGMKRHLVLPFARDTFRAMSVTDRPGDFGPLFDRIYRELTPDHITTLHTKHDLNRDFAQANQQILRKALALRQAEAVPGLAASQVLATLVWDGVSRGDDDFTARFANEAGKLGFPVYTILTVTSPPSLLHIGGNP